MTCLPMTLSALKANAAPFGLLWMRQGRAMGQDAFLRTRVAPRAPGLADLLSEERLERSLDAKTLFGDGRHMTNALPAVRSNASDDQLVGRWTAKAAAKLGLTPPGGWPRLAGLLFVALAAQAVTRPSIALKHVCPLSETDLKERAPPLPNSEYGRIQIRQRCSLLPYRGVLFFLSEAQGSTGSETARVHHAYRRRGGMAARGRRAAGRANAADRCANGLAGERSGSPVGARSVRPRASEIGLVRRPQSADRYPLGEPRRSGVDASIREGTRRVTARPHSFT